MVLLDLRANVFYDRKGVGRHTGPHAKEEEGFICWGLLFRELNTRLNSVALHGWEQTCEGEVWRLIRWAHAARLFLGAALRLEERAVLVAASRVGSSRGA